MRTLGLAPLHRALGEKGLLLSSIPKGGLGGKGRCQTGTEDPGHSSWATLKHVASYNVSPFSHVPIGGILNPPDGHPGWPHSTMVYWSPRCATAGVLLTLALSYPEASS